MKKAIIWIILMTLLCSTISSCSFPSRASFQPEASSSVVLSSSSENLPNGSLTIVDLTEQIFAGEFKTLNQICYLTEKEDLIYLNVSSGNQSKLISLDLNSNTVKKLFIKDSIFHADIFSDKAYLFSNHQAVEYTFSTQDKVVWELPEDLILEKGKILPSKQEMAYPDDHQLLLIPLSNIEAQEVITLPDGLSALLVEPLSDDLFYIATREEERGQTILILDRNGTIKYRYILDAVYPVQWKNGLLLTEGIDGQSGSLYLLNGESGEIRQLLTQSRAEANHATISFNGQWVLTADYREESNTIKLNLYKVDEKIFYEYTVSDENFSGIVNFANGSDSLFISDDGCTGGVYFLDDEGPHFFKLDFVHENAYRKDFELLEMEK